MNEHLKRARNSRQGRLSGQRKIVAGSVRCSFTNVVSTMEFGLLPCQLRDLYISSLIS